MGIERFFSGIESSDINIKNKFTHFFKQKLHIDYMYIDFNSIIYITNYKVLSDLNKILYLIVRNKSKNILFSEIVEKYGLKIKDTITASEYNKYIMDRIDKLILKSIEKYILNMLENYIKSDKLQYLYIAVDGVPSKAKMIEQKRRRYIGVISSDISKRIYDKHKSKLSKNRYLYEENKILWSTNKITPGTVFMHKLDTLLKDTIFHSKIKNICKNLKSYTYSGMYEYGEGEKKIVDNIRSVHHKKGQYLIYSPDSDVTLLSLILSCRLENDIKQSISDIKILRHNQQKNMYNIIDISTLNKNIYNYVKNKVKRNLDTSQVILDIVLLLTIFGNDFLPKINTYDARNDFVNIITIYANTIRSKDKHIINLPNSIKDKRTINFDILLTIIKELSANENSNINKIYLESNYHNYRKLKEIFKSDSDNFQQKVSAFLDKLKEFDQNIKNNKLPVISEDFADKIKKLTKIGIPFNASPKEIVKLYHNYCKKYNKLPIINITLQRYNKSINNHFYRNKLKLLSDRSAFSQTEYDVELYQFSNMLDKYATKLNSTPLGLGFIQVDIKNYKFKSEPIDSSIKKYYNTYFGIVNTDTSSKKMNDLLQSYIKGLLWVFDYYFNNFSIEDNRSKALVWFYKYKHSPLLQDIYKMLNTLSSDDIDKMLIEIRKKIVPTSIYFSCIEHLMYVSCAPMILDIIPEELHLFAKSKYYPNMNLIIDNIYNKDTNDMIDCKNAMFMSKCDLLFLYPEKTFDEDIDGFLKDIRKIKLSQETKKRACIYKIDNNIYKHTFPKIIKLGDIN